MIPVDKSEFFHKCVICGGDWVVDLRFTALRTLLSRGFLLGSLVEERIPVPQLLAKVFLQGYRVNTRGQSQQKPANNGTHESSSSGSTQSTALHNTATDGVRKLLCDKRR